MSSKVAGSSRDMIVQINGILKSLGLTWWGNSSRVYCLALVCQDSISRFEIYRNAHGMTELAISRSMLAEKRRVKASRQNANSWCSPAEILPLKSTEVSAI